MHLLGCGLEAGRVDPRFQGCNGRDNLADLFLGLLLRGLEDFYRAFQVVVDLLDLLHLDVQLRVSFCDGLLDVLGRQLRHVDY